MTEINGTNMVTPKCWWTVDMRIKYAACVMKRYPTNLNSSVS